METGFSVEGARSKRVMEQEQPAQQPMRVRKLRRNPDNGQKKARRQMQRKTAATKESTVDFNQREAEILTAMGRATLPEQQRLATELGNLRAQRAAALEADREIDVSSAVIRDHLTPVATHTMNTTATDWLDEAESEEVGDAERIVQAMRTEASLWFGRISADVKADREEFAEQAQGFARHAASAFGMGAPIAQRAFLDYVGHLHTADSAVVTEPFPDSVPGPQNDQTTPWTERVTTGPSAEEARAAGQPYMDDPTLEDDEHVGSLRAQAYASHQTHSLISQSALRHLAEEGGTTVEHHDRNPEDFRRQDEDDSGKEDWQTQHTTASRHTADDSPGKVDVEQSGNAESTITPYDTMGNDPEPFDEKFNGPLQPTGPFAVPSTRAPNVQGSLRPIAVIAADIDINSVPPNARPYLAAMDALTTVDDAFGPQDDGRTVVSYFLANAPGIAQEAELRTHVAMTLDEARAAKAQFLAELQEVTAGDPQSGEAQSHDSEVQVGNPNDRPMWPWETPLIGDEGASGTDGTASNVGGVSTPGQNVADYPQPKSGSLHVAYPTRDAMDDPRHFSNELDLKEKHDPEWKVPEPREPEPPWDKQGAFNVRGGGTPFVQAVQEGGEHTALKVRELEGRSYEATCPNPDCEHHGVSFVHDDLSQDDDDEAVCPTCETPLAWHNHTGSQHTAAYNPLADPNTPYNSPKKPTAEERQWREQFPEGVPLRGDLTPDQQRVLRRRSALEAQGRLSRNCLNGNHSDCTASSCTCPHHNRKEKSGACADGDHSSCKMSHGPGADQCNCTHSTHKSASLQKGAPFAGYDDFDACVAANKDKRDPEAYCGKIKHQVEGAASHKVHPNGVVEVFDHDAYRKEKTYYDPAHDKVMDHSRIATDGTCGRSWDDAVSSSMTPAPSARCPFEYEHEDEDDSHTSSRHTAAPRKPNVPFQIKWLVNRIHVGTSDEDVEKDFRSRCKKAGHDEATTKQVVNHALKQHHYNQAEYGRIMGSVQTDQTRLAAFRASVKVADLPDYNSRSARDAMEMGYGGKDYWDYLDQHAQELHDHFKSKGDHETANSMFTRTLSESLQGNEGD